VIELRADADQRVRCRARIELERHRQPSVLERELEIFRLRTVEGLTLTEIGKRAGLNRTRVDQLLRLRFRLNEVPPAAKRKRRARND
jgi:DNA-directed RNA polymerase specialized sigma24 family protein